MDYILTFLKLFIIGTYLVLPLFLLLGIIVIALGQVVGRIEGWTRYNALYWSLITATTVGYGDIRPLQKSSKALSILIAFVGIMFTGILISITLETSAIAFRQHVDVAALLGS